VIVLLVLLLALAVSLFTGGRVRYAQGFELRALPIGVGAFAVQALIFTPRSETALGSWLPVMYMLTMCSLMVFLWLNRHVSGVPVLMVGLMLNLVVIVANGGWMPVDPQALIATGQSERAALLMQAGRAANCVLMSEASHLNFLGDRIVIPFLGTLGSAFSIGDLVTLAGEAVLVFGMVRPKTAEPANGESYGGVGTGSETNQSRTGSSEHANGKWPDGA